MKKLTNAFMRYSFILTLWIGCTMAHGALTAQVNRTQLNTQETLTYTLTLDQQGVSREPNFSLLTQNFSIMAKEQSSNINVLNGQMNAQTSWTLELAPKHAGKFILPAILLGGQSSQPIEVNVTDGNARQTTTASQQAPISIVLTANKTSAYLQEQIILTLRVYHQVNIIDGTLSDLTANNATIKSLGNKKTYTTEIHHVMYKVIEQQYSVFAQQAGKQTISPVLLDAIIEQPTQQTFFLSSFNQNTQQRIQLRSNAIQLTIKPKPAQYPANALWLPTTQLQTHVSWNPSQNSMKLGDPITQVITLTAQGLPANRLPDLQPITPIGMKNYPDQPQLQDTTTDQGITGQKTQSIAWLSTQSGHFQLPSQRIYWWNTNKDELAMNDIPGRQMDVIQTPGTSTPIASSNTRASFSNKIPRNTQLPPRVFKQNNIVTHLVWWEILAASLSGIIFLLLIGLWYLRRQIKKLKRITQTSINEHEKILRPDLNRLFKSALQACEQSDPKIAKKAVDAWYLIFAQTHSPSQAALSHFEQAMHQLNAHLYGYESTVWSGAELKQSILILEKSSMNSDNKTTDALAPLYP